MQNIDGAFRRVHAAATSSDGQQEVNSSADASAPSPMAPRSRELVTTRSGALAGLQPYARRRPSADDVREENAHTGHTEEATALAVSISLRTPGIPDMPAHALGPLVGRGSQKDVYRLTDEPRHCVALVRTDAIGRFDTPATHAQREMDALLKLRARGFRTVETYRLVRIGDRVGIEQAYLRQARHSADIVGAPSKVPEGQYLTQRTVEQCDSTIATLRKTATVIDDLQFLVEPRGDIHISDPRAVMDGNPEKNIGTVKALRGAAIERLLSSDDEE